MGRWTIELIRVEVGSQGRWLSGRYERWLWRAYEGSDEYSPEALKEMYDRNDYFSGSASGRTHYEPNRIRDIALEDAKAACDADQRRRGNMRTEIHGYCST